MICAHIMQNMITGTGKLNFDSFTEIAGHFLEEEDDEAMQQELKEAFRLYDREGKDVLKLILASFICIALQCIGIKHLLG